MSSILPKESWGTRLGLILAMAGNAVGLGNLLRFPVQAVQNGGGAFMIPYLVCFVLLGIPMLWMEWAIGRFGGKENHHHTPFILHSLDKKRAFWKYVGAFGLFINIAVAAYYIYVESWTLSYSLYSFFGYFNGKNPEEIASFFDRYVAGEVTIAGMPLSILVWILCLGLNVWIISKGIKDGIETVAKIAMPLLIFFGLLLAVKAVFLKGGGESGAVFDGLFGLNYLWKPDFSTIWSPKVWLAAAGQIFFTLSVGMGAVQCYASYVREKEDIALNAMAAGWLNEFVEVIIGGGIVIPIAIGYLGIDGVNAIIAQSGGIGLGFKTLPSLFANWGTILSIIAGTMWFSLLFFAGITSSLAMGLPVTAFVEESLSVSRKNASLIFGGVVLALGLPVVLYFKYGVFDEFDYWAGTVALVIFAIFETILFGWIFGIEKGWAEILEGAEIKVPVFFKYTIKYITPFLLILFLAASFVQPEYKEGKIITHFDVIKKDTLFWKDTVKGKEIVRFKAYKNDTIVKRDTLANSNEWARALDSVSRGKMWAMDDNAIISRIYHKNLRSEILKMEDTLTLLYKTRNKPEVFKKIEAAHKKIQFLRAKRRFVNGSRLLLLTVYFGLCLLVFRMKPITEKKKEPNPENTPDEVQK